MADVPATTLPESVQSIFDLPITDKQRRFVLAMIGPAMFNASEAARLAGYPKKHAGEIGYQLRKTPTIQAMLREALEAEALDAAAALHLTIQDAVRTDASIMEIAAQAPGAAAQAAAVSSLIAARTTARQNLGKAHGLFRDKVDVDVRSVQVIVNGVDLDRFGEPAIDTESHEVNR